MRFKSKKRGSHGNGRRRWAKFLKPGGIRLS